MAGAFNLFQSTMLAWRSRHPYNAVHAARLGRPVERERLERAIASVLEDAGLTGYVLDATRRRYAWRGGAADVTLALSRAGGDVEEALRAAFERALAVRFAPDGPYVPFAFEAIEDGDDGWLVLAYDHVVAGGDSAAALLGAIDARYRGEVPIARLERDPPRFRRHLARHPIAVLRGLLSIPQLARRSRHARRPPGLAERDPANAFFFAPVKPGTDARLAATARAWGVARNDVLMAALMRAVAAMRPPARSGSRRSEVAIASIINLRGECAAPVGTVFGQFLSPFRSGYPAPDTAPLETVARAVHADSRDMKQRRRYVRSLAALAIASLAWRSLDASRRDSLYAKHYPVWAGLTPLGIAGAWDAMTAAAGERPRDYRRGVSTGPLAPIVVAATYTGRALELGVSFRPAAIGASEVRAAIDRFVADLESLHGTSSPPGQSYEPSPADAGRRAPEA